MSNNTANAINTAHRLITLPLFALALAAGCAENPSTNPASQAAPTENTPHLEDEAMTTPEPNPQAALDTDAPTFVLGHTAQTITGDAVTLQDQFAGKVMLIVNVASQCGLTPQYTGLQELYATYQDQGFTVVGFPANNFAGQEPGTNEQILEFCSTEHAVTFPMMAKVSVKGDDAHPLYQQLANLEEPLGGEPGWNFTKFLVDRTGKVVQRFEPATEPTAQQITAAIEHYLSQS